MAVIIPSRSAPPLDRTILTIDIIDSTSRSSYPYSQVAMRAGLNGVLRKAFLDSEIPWSSCHIEDRGNGAIILIPANVPKMLLVDPLPDLLVAELRRYNDRHPVDERISLRMRLHVGEVIVGDQGAVAESIDHAHGILAAWTARSSHWASGGVIVSPASVSYYRAGVARHAASTPGPPTGRDFDAFYLHTYRLVRNVIHARSQDWGLAEDIANEALAIAYRKWDELVEHPNPVGFVVLTARRILSKVQRQRAKRPPHPPPLPVDAGRCLDNYLVQADPAAAAVDRVALAIALATLPPDHRECFVLHHILDRPVREISALLGVPEGTVKTRLRAARLALRELLGEGASGEYQY
jgi:RNA polymerase sigma factor (sigma-70 family)